MKPKLSFIPPIGIVLALVLGAADSRADDDRDDLRNAYTVNPLVSDLPGAPVQDPVLQNAWGVAFTPAGSPFWVADNATGCATLYNGDGTKVALQVSIPLPGGGINTDCVHVNPNRPPNPTPAAPTGIIWNPTTNPATAFLVPGSNPPTPAIFIFATEDGTISAWAGGNHATLAVDKSKIPTPASGAVYKGLAFGVNKNGDFIYAANFRAGTIDVFDHGYNPATTDGGFVDPNIQRASHRSISRASMATCSSLTPSKTRKSTTTLPGEETALSTCSTLMVICCAVLPVARLLIHPGA